MNLKKLISGVTALALCFSLAACGGTPSSDSSGIFRACGTGNRHPGGHCFCGAGIPGNFRHPAAHCRPEGPHHHGPVQPDQRHQG